MADKDQTEKYAYLNQLSTEVLEELLRADIESLENDNDEVVFHILEVIRRREQENPTGDIFDVDKAWTEFKQYYNTPEGESLALYPTEDEDEDLVDDKEETPTPKHRTKIIHLSHTLKVASIAAIVVICIFGLMLGVQAAGFDIFGAIGRWTDETFHFVTSPAGAVQGDTNTGISVTQRNSEYYSTLQNALDECGITEKLAPTWYPEEFEMSEPKISSTDLNEKISCDFSGPKDKFFRIQVRRYHLRSEVDAHTFEKDNSNVSTYEANAKTFYIISNIDATTATWSDGNLLVLSITGNLSEDDLKNIIDSIGGKLN